MLKKRLITAFCLIPLVVVVVWFDQPLPWMTVFAAVWGLLAAREFYQAVSVSRPEAPPLTVFGLLFILALIVSPHFDYAYIKPLLLAAAALPSLVWLWLRRRSDGVFFSWIWTLTGIIYIGWLISQLVALRQLEYGRDWVLFALLVTFASDSAAFFVGSAIGRHPLAPNISPKKTWEGAVGGVFGAAGIGMLLVLVLDLPIGYWVAAPLAVAASVFGQFGDLLESVFKRGMGLKDSGNTVPGHGGFLDRMDSVIFAGAVVYCCAVAICGV